MHSLEPSLDPEDFDNLSTLFKGLVDGVISHWQTEDSRLWKAPPPELLAHISLEDHEEGVGLDALADELASFLPYSSGNTHRRYYGWVHGTGSVAGTMGDLICSTLNSNCSGRNHLATFIERSVIDWAKTIFGFPHTSSGLLVSGSSQATLLALSVARYKFLGPDSLSNGLSGMPRLRVYACSNVHMSIKKALQILGVGDNNLVKVSLDPATRSLDTYDLESQINQDLDQGYTPFAIIASSGSVDAGLFDNLHDVSLVSSKYNLWFHLDAAFGAWIKLASEPYSSLVSGLHLVDSIACDFHKWLHVPYDAGLVLIKDSQLHLEAFAYRPHYLNSGTGLASGDPWFCDYGTDLSRSFRALRVWSTIRAYGSSLLGAAITKNCLQAKYLGSLISRSKILRTHELIVSNICLFGLDNSDFSDQDLSMVNKQVYDILDSSPDPLVSTTVYNGILVLRACFTNHRTSSDDVLLSFESIENIYRSVLLGLRLPSL
jgi:glutamate/tyrosine decarboxylase-like PLP-dependent enzyme